MKKAIALLSLIATITHGSISHEIEQQKREEQRLFEGIVETKLPNIAIAENFTIIMPVPMQGVIGMTLMIAVTIPFVK